MERQDDTFGNETIHESQGFYGARGGFRVGPGAGRCVRLGVDLRDCHGYPAEEKQPRMKQDLLYFPSQVYGTKGREGAFGSVEWHLAS